MLVEIVTNAPANSISVDISKTFCGKAAFMVKAEGLYRWGGVNIMDFLNVNQPDIPSVDHHWTTHRLDYSEWPLPRVTKGLSRVHRGGDFFCKRSKDFSQSRRVQLDVKESLRAIWPS